ncbi:MAG: Unknown protein [uncultured Thiotrichaceae bacterium]|uniref:Abnormal spindle-like microcephaly-associated protein ASH domain-containing protein n=1 Tax=uncultured Thiotrichaceae bacterium TaxID=298394 RepID=A0A6S6UAI3_9GAMM|nr:MAG: Unknown protein [uncultured Thiotrichaceae bacterium]
MNKMKRLVSAAVLATLSVNASAVTSAESTTISVNPSVYVFKEVEPNSQSSSVTVKVKNTGASPRAIGSLSLSGDHADQYQLSADTCTGMTVAADSECSVSVTYTPTARGHKQALLNINSDSPDTPLLQAFLTSREDVYSESSRRLPPVLYAVNIPETMTSGQTYTLEWSILGYHDDYISSVVMFDCTGITDGSCGNSYSDSTRFFESGAVSDHQNVTTSWHNGDVYAKEFKFQQTFTPSFATATDIVVRFYRLNTDDKDAGLGGLSLIIPGNLSSDYYDKEGRRIEKTILP